MMDASDVEQVLPVGLRLAGQASGSTKHPVIYLTGLQDDPLGLAAGKTYPIIGAKPYEEVIFLVPFVVRTTGTEKWHTFVMRMFLTDVGAVVIGNGVYGYAKKHAKVELTGTPPALSTRASAQLLAIPYFASNATASGAWQPAGSAALPRWSDLREIMEMPVVGVVGPNSSARTSSGTTATPRSRRRRACTATARRSSAAWRTGWRWGRSRARRAARWQCASCAGGCRSI